MTSYLHLLFTNHVLMMFKETDGNDIGLPITYYFCNF